METTDEQMDQEMPDQENDQQPMDSAANVQEDAKIETNKQPATEENQEESKDEPRFEKID